MIIISKISHHLEAALITNHRICYVFGKCMDETLVFVREKMRDTLLNERRDIRPCSMGR